MPQFRQVMPNGEAPPDPREAERRQVQAAQLTSAAEYDQREQCVSPTLRCVERCWTTRPLTSFAPARCDNRFAAAISPGSQRQAISPTATEEEQLAYVLQMSALEAASPPPPAAAAARGGGDDELREQEEAELAMALSLSLADTNAGAADIIDSDDESIADSDTPPNSPYVLVCIGSHQPSGVHHTRRDAYTSWFLFAGTLAISLGKATVEGRLHTQSLLMLMPRAPN